MDIDSVISRIKKAIRLARGTTSEGERKTALHLARSLAEKNGLAFEDIDATREDAGAVKVDDEGAEEWITGCEIGLACFIIKEHFGVVVMLNTNRRGKGYYSWFGTRLNIDIARHVHHILLRECRKAYREVKKECDRVGAGKLDKKAFMHGFFVAIHNRLLAQPLRNDTAQLEAERTAAQRKFDDFGKSTRVAMKSSRASAKSSPGSIEMGLMYGGRVSLARPCRDASAKATAISMK